MGTISTVGVILIIIYLVWNKFCVNKYVNNETLEGKNIPYENNVDEEIEIQTTKKRSIHN